MATWNGWDSYDKSLLSRQVIVRKHFNSSTELLAWYDKEVANGAELYNPYERGREGRDAVAKGRRDLIPEIEKMAEEIWENIPTLQRVWRRDLVGAFPSVPDYLAGYPENMYAMKLDTSEHTPLRIWVGLASSGGVTGEQLKKRGAAIAAFAQALSQVRPVYVSPYTCGGSHSNNIDSVVVSWDLQTSPLVLSELAAAIMSEEVMRPFAFNCEVIANPRTTVAWMKGYENEYHMRRALDANDEDLWLTSIHLNDPLLTDPIGWVKAHLAKYAQEEE